MSISSTDFEFIQSLIRQRSGNVINSSQAYLLESRLDPVIRSQGLSSLDQLTQKLRLQPVSPLTDMVVEAMTINETQFLRDGKPFHELCTKAIPDLISRRSSGKSLTFWSAACSSGQEPYSLPHGAA